MNSPQRRRSPCSFLAPFAALLLAVGLVLAPAAAAAPPAKPKAPTLASTAQYKAFVGLVKKLDSLAGQPTTGAQKATWEAELSAKKEATARKSEALFLRSQQEAQAQANRKQKADTTLIRGNEHEEVLAVETEFKEKLEKAARNYQSVLNRISDDHHGLEDKLHEEIDKLRIQKAKANGAAAKAKVQEQITKLSKAVGENRTKEKEDRAATAGNYRNQKEKLTGNRAAKKAAAEEAADEVVAHIARHYRKAFDNKKASLQGKRDTQLAYLEVKLEQGRLDVASMPAVG
jgi:hypothetical protein